MEIRLSKDAVVRDKSAPWKYRVAYACAGDPALFPIVVAFTGVVTVIPPGMPQWHSPATIGQDGNLYGQIRNDIGDVSPGFHFMGKLQTVVDLLRTLADHCKLDDNERVVMFDEFKKWTKDLRAKSGGLDKVRRT